MSFGSHLQNILNENKITVSELSRKTGISTNTLYAMIRRNSNNINASNLLKISEALNMPLHVLLKWDSNEEMNHYSKMYEDHSGKSNNDTTYFLEQKLAQVGYSIGGIESEGYLWINYPDGTLEVTETDLKELDESSKSYLKFQLEELKQKNIKDFKKK
jgi:transcriptional regulator with XRE-family HTH domain